MNPLQKVAAPLLVGALLVVIGVFTSSWLKMSQSYGDDDDGGGSFSIGVGLRSVEMCSSGKEHGSKCESKSYSDDDHGHREGRETAMMVFGNIAFFVGLAAAAAAVACGLMVMQRKNNLVKLVIPLAAVGAACAVGFLVAVPSMDGKGPGWSPGFSLFAYFLGAGAMIVGAAMAAKALGTYIPPGIAQQGYPGQPGYPPQGYPQAGQLPHQPGYPHQQAGYPQQPGGYPQSASQPMPPQGAAQPMPQATPPCPRDGAPSVWVAQYQRYFCERCQQYL